MSTNCSALACYSHRRTDEDHQIEDALITSLIAPGSKRRRGKRQSTLGPLSSNLPTRSNIQHPKYTLDGSVGTLFEPVSHTGSVNAWAISGTLVPAGQISHLSYSPSVSPTFGSSPGIRYPEHIRSWIIGGTVGPACQTRFISRRTVWQAALVRDDLLKVLPVCCLPILRAAPGPDIQSPMSSFPKGSMKKIVGPDSCTSPNTVLITYGLVSTGPPCWRSCPWGLFAFDLLTYRVWLWDRVSNMKSRSAQASLGQRKILGPVYPI